MSDEGSDPSALLSPAASVASPRRVMRGAWAFYLLLGLASFGMLYVSSLPGSPLVLALPVLGLCMIVAVFWLVRVGSAIRHRIFEPLLVLGPAVILLFAALSASPWPLQARFDTSRSSFDATIRALPAGQSEGGSLGRVGSYWIDRWSRSGDAYLLYDANGTDLVDYAGFAYSASGVPPALTQSGDPGFEVAGWTDLGGGWFAWQASW